MKDSYFKIKRKIKKATGIEITSKQYDFMRCPALIDKDSKENFDEQNDASYALIFYICIYTKYGVDCYMPSTNNSHFIPSRTTANLVLAFLGEHNVTSKYFVTWFNSELKRIYTLLKESGVEVSSVNFHESLKKQEQ